MPVDAATAEARSTMVSPEIVGGFFVIGQRGLQYREPVA